MNVSFIIPHNGRYNLLVDTVASLIQLDYAKADYEVIVVSQNPDIDISIFDGLDLHDLQLSIVHFPGKNISAQRNYGFTLAKGNYIAYIDADVALSANWIQAMLSELADPTVAVSSAVQRKTDETSGLEALRVALSNVEIDCDVSFLPGRNLLLHRLVVEKIGGFPEHLTTCEDYFFTDKAAQYGRLRYVSSATYAHLGEDRDYSTLWTKEKWRGQSNLLALKGRKIQLREWPSIIAPVLLAALLVIAAVQVLLLNVSMASVSLLLAMGIPTLYAFRLKNISPELPWSEVIKFYFTYFPARAIGSVVGVFKSFDLKKVD